MAAAIKQENLIENDAVIKLKLETAAIVENLVRNLDAKISTAHDFKILTDSILQREAMIRHLQYIISNQSVSSKPKLVCQEQQTFPEAQLIDQERQTDPQELLATPHPVKNINTVSTQTDQDEVILSNLTKISKLEMDISKMYHNQDLLLLELNFQKEDNIALQAEIAIMTKRMAKVT